MLYPRESESLRAILKEIFLIMQQLYFIYIQAVMTYSRTTKYDSVLSS